MYFRDVIALVDVCSTPDADGYKTPQETKTEVFADLQSVRRAEFYDSLRAGVKMAEAFVVRAFDYSGQAYVEHDGKRYKVERTYTKDGEFVELNCSEVEGK